MVFDLCPYLLFLCGRGSGVQQHGAAVSAGGEEDSSPHQTQPQRGGRRQDGQSEQPEGPRSLLAAGLTRDVSSPPRHLLPLHQRSVASANLSSLLSPPLLSLRKRLSVSESSHTESDSSPPLTVRRRCCSAIIEMPRFAISSEEEGGQGRCGRRCWEEVLLVSQIREPAALFQAQLDVGGAPAWPGARGGRSFPRPFQSFPWRES